MEPASAFCHSASALCVCQSLWSLWVLFGVVCQAYPTTFKAIDKTKHTCDSRSRFRLCVPPCPRYITSGDTHKLCVACLGGNIRSRLSRERSMAAPWLLWWQQRDICGWPSQTWERKIGSASWTPRLRLLACSATPSMQSSTGTRRPVNKRRHSSGSSLAALELLGLLGGSRVRARSRVRSVPGAHRVHTQSSWGSGGICSRSSCSTPGTRVYLCLQALFLYFLFPPLTPYSTPALPFPLLGAWECLEAVPLRGGYVMSPGPPTIPLTTRGHHLPSSWTQLL